MEELSIALSIAIVGSIIGLALVYWAISKILTTNTKKSQN